MIGSQQALKGSDFTGLSAHDGLKRQSEVSTIETLLEHLSFVLRRGLFLDLVDLHHASPGGHGVLES